MSKLITLLACAVMLSGCAHGKFTKGRGDVSEFIVHQAMIRGGQPITTNDLPVLAESWKYFEDEKGVVVCLKRQSCDKVKALLLHAFGNPTHASKNTEDGTEWIAYRLTAKGGGIQIACIDDVTQVIIIRPLSNNEFSDSVKNILQDKEIQKELLKNH
jgi:hypothetical protein